MKYFIQHLLSLAERS